MGVDSDKQEKAKDEGAAAPEKRAAGAEDSDKRPADESVDAKKSDDDEAESDGEKSGADEAEGDKTGEEKADEDGDETSAAGDEPAAPAAPKRKKKKKAKAKADAPAPAPPPAKASTPLLLVGGLVIAALVGGGVYLIRRQSGPHKRSVGDEIDVELTLVAADNRNLACASAEEVAGRHCAFEAQTKPWSKTTETDDKKILKPYTAVDRSQLLAAGLWSEPALSGGKLPTSRFSVKCKFKVEGSVKKPSIRWAAAGAWNDSPRDWDAGVVSGCTLVPSP